MNATFECHKVALRRLPGFPLGVSAPLYIVCPKDRLEVLVPEVGDTFTCPGCGTAFTRAGWIVPNR